MQLDFIDEFEVQCFQTSDPSWVSFYNNGFGWKPTLPKVKSFLYVMDSKPNLSDVPSVNHLECNAWPIEQKPHHVYEQLSVLRTFASLNINFGRQLSRLSNLVKLTLFSDFLPNHFVFLSSLKNLEELDVRVPTCNSSKEGELNTSNKILDSAPRLSLVLDLPRLRTLTISATGRHQSLYFVLPKLTTLYTKYISVYKMFNLSQSPVCHLKLDECALKVAPTMKYIEFHLPHVQHLTLGSHVIWKDAKRKTSLRLTTLKIEIYKNEFKRVKGLKGARKIIAGWFHPNASLEDEQSMVIEGMQGLAWIWTRNNWSICT
jgi:hypothetical protein